jgi:ATP-dependent 26S proteasome regulatory subunit
MITKLVRKCKKCKLYLSDNIDKNIAYKSINNPCTYIKWNNSLKYLVPDNALTSDDEYILYSNIGYIEDYIMEYIDSSELELKSVNIKHITNVNTSKIIKFNDIKIGNIRGQLTNSNIINYDNFVFELENNDIGLIGPNTVIKLSPHLKLSHISNKIIELNNVVVVLNIDLVSKHDYIIYIDVTKFNSCLSIYLENNVVNSYNQFIIMIDNINIGIKINMIEHILFDIKLPNTYYKINSSKLVIDNIISSKFVFYNKEYKLNKSNSTIQFKILSSSKKIIEYDIVYDLLKNKLQTISEIYTDSVIEIHYVHHITNEYLNMSFSIEFVKVDNQILLSNKKNINKFILNSSNTIDYKISINLSSDQKYYLIKDNLSKDLKNIKLLITKKIQSAINSDIIPILSDKQTQSKNIRDQLKMSDILNKLIYFLYDNCLVENYSFEDPDYVYQIIDFEYIENLSRENIYLTTINDNTIIDILKYSDDIIIINNRTINNSSINNSSINNSSNIIKTTCINIDIDHIRNFHKKIIENNMGGMQKYIDKIIREVLISRTNILDKSITKHMKVSNGIILYGPPGTGKTTFAKNIGKIIGCEPSNITMLTSTELLNKYLGQSEQNIRELFNKAISDYTLLGDQSPLYLIIIDEIDAILGSRGTNIDSGIRDSIVNQFLGILDGLNTTNNFIIIGITNLLSKIDKAVLRPGRFGCHIYIGLPDFDQRKEIINLNINKFNSDGSIFENFDIDHLTKMTENFSGADIENIFIQAINKYIFFKLNNHNYNKKISSSDIDEIILDMTKY